MQKKNRRVRRWNPSSKAASKPVSVLNCSLWRQSPDRVGLVRLEQGSVGGWAVGGPCGVRWRLRMSA